MKFDPAEGAWRCQERGCDVRLFPKTIVENDGVPTVGVGPLEILEYTDNDNIVNYVLRATGNNIVIDITDHVRKIAKRMDDASGAVVTFDVERWAVTDGRTKRKKRQR